MDGKSGRRAGVVQALFFYLCLAISGLPATKGDLKRLGVDYLF